MHIRIIPFYLFIYSFSFSQKIIIIDKETKTTLSYVNILNTNTKKGYYTNNSGTFELSNTSSQNDSIQIFSLGYNSITLLVKNIKDTIYLKSKSEILNEITLNTNSKKYEKIGFKKANIGWYGVHNFQIGLLVKPKKEYENTCLEKIRVPFLKKIYGKKKIKYNSVFKLTVLSVKENKPLAPILKRPIIIKFNEKSSKYIDLDLSEYSIVFKKEGVFISMEKIGEIDQYGEVKLKQEDLPGLGFSTKKPKGFIYFKSFYKEKFSNNWKELDYQKMYLNKPLFLALEFFLVE